MKEIMKRLISTALVMAMLLSFFPSTMFVVAKATDNVEKSPIDQSTYEALGFVTSLNDEQSQLANTPYLGNVGNKTTMNVKNELYLDYQAHKNYGWVLRDNLNLHHTSWDSYRAIGAYRLYGQFMNYSKTDDLDGKNGWTYGQTGGTDSLIGSGITSTGTHKSRAYKTAVEFRSASGKKDLVAQLYVTAGAARTNWVAKLEILNYTKGDDGKYTPSVTSTATLGASPALDESGMIFQQYFDALYDITAGDFDGDGIDEIAVYYGTNEVKIFDTGSYGTKLSLSQTIGKSEILKNTTISPLYNSDSKHGSENKVERAAIVTLTAGDLKKDFTDDLVITVSMPQGSTGDAHRDNPYAYIYDYKKTDDTSSFEKEEEIRLYVDDLKTTSTANDAQVFKTANAAIGDIDGDSCMELIIGGRLCDASDDGTDDTSWGAGALIPVEYNHSSKNYSVGTATQVELSEYDSGKVLIDDGIDDQVIRYRAPVAMAVADLDGMGTDKPHTFFFSELYTYDASHKSFSDTGIHLDTIKNQTNNVNEGEAKGQHWISDIVVGNFNGNDVGAEQIIAIVACKTNGNTETDQDWYWYYMSYMAYGNITSTESDGKTTVTKGDFSAQCEGIINQGRSYINRRDVTRASTFVSIACPDVDDDSILLEHIGTETYYSKPEVQAVLQSAPYFADVAEVYDDYLNDGVTAYGRVKGTGSGKSASVEASLGAYVDTEVQLGGAAQLEVELGVNTAYDHLTMSEVETSVTYEGFVGNDFVVMYTIPYIRHLYNATFTDGKRGVLTIEEPLTPATVIVPVDTYDAIAAETEGLEPVRGNILTSTPGDPSSYINAPKGKWQPIGDVQTLTNSFGSLVEITQTATETEEDSFSIGVEESLKMGGGAGIFGEKAIAGAYQTFSIAGGGAYSDMSGVEYTGSVDNLPTDVHGYGFSWQFGVSETKLNGEDIIVVGYQTSKVKQAPTLPKDLSVVNVTSESATVEWDVSPDAAMYEVYISTDLSKWIRQAPVPATYAANGKLRYTVQELTPSETYYFRVKACDTYGMRSLETNPLTVRTLKNNSTLTIVKQPSDASTALGDNVTFEIGVQSSSSSSLQYQWEVRTLYKNDKGQNVYSNWKEISSNDAHYSGANGPLLTVKNTTSSDDGSLFRCCVGQVADYIYSNEAKLEISKSESATSLELKVGDNTINNGDTVNAASTTVTNEETTVTEWIEDVNADGYSKLATYEIETETVDKDGKVTYSYKYDNAKYIWEKKFTEGTGDNEIVYNKYYADNNGTVDREITVNYVFTSGAGENVTTFKTSSTAKDGTFPIATAYTEGSPTASSTVEASSRYSIIDSNDHIYVVETETSGTNDKGDSFTSVSTEYYAPTGTHTYTDEDGEQTVPVYSEVSLNDEGSYIVIDNNEYALNTLVHVKKPIKTKVVTGQTVKPIAGDKLQLSATVTALHQTAEDNVCFYLEDASSGAVVTVPATKGDSNVWTAEYTFSSTGIYRISAYYSGNGKHFSSRSTETLIYVTSPASTLILEGGSMTFGQSFNLNPTLFKGAVKEAIASGITYSVTKDGVAVSEDVTGNLISENNVFTPDEAGTYTIFATYENDSKTYTTSSTVVVGKRAVTITAPATITVDVDSSIADRQALLGSDKVTISNVPDAYSTDEDTIRSIISLSSEPTSKQINAEGEYAIEVNFDTESDKNKALYTALSSKYSFVLIPGTLKLTQGYVNVNATSGLNGSVQISYTTTISDSNGEYTSSPLTVTSGTSLPVGAQVTVTAVPNPGFGISMWTVNGKEIAGNTSTEYSFVLEDSDEDINIGVSFAYIYTTLNFTAEGNGTVTGVYSGSSTPFNNGDQINSTISVDLTATPDEGYVVSKWERTVNGETEVVKAEDGTSTYTGNTITVSGVNSATSYKVYFETAQKATVTVKLLHKSSNEAIHGCKVNFNGVAYTSDDNVFTFDTNKHGNVTVSIDIPANMLVDHWKKDGNIVEGAVEEITIYNIDDSMEYTVYCETPAARKLTFGAYWTDSNTNHATEDISNAGTVTVYRNGSEITESGKEHPQGSEIKVTAAANEGYRIAKWELDGNIVAGEGIQSYTFYLNSDSNIKVIFEKKPVVTITNAEHGKIVATVGNTTMGKFVEFGSTVELSIRPDFGYVVESVMVNNADATTDFLPVANSDFKEYTLENIQINANIVVKYKALDTTPVTFGIIDKNGETEGGLDGTLTASVNRNNIDSYKVENAEEFTEEIFEGSTVTFTATPENGYRVSKWFVNGVEVTDESDLKVNNDNTATLKIDTPLNAQHIDVQFDPIGEKVTYAIRSDASSKVELSATFTPSGGIVANFPSGNRPTANGIISITANNLPAGYEIEGWYVNSVKVEGETSETFYYNAVVNTGAKIEVVIIRSSYEVTFSAENGGTITATATEAITSGDKIVGDTEVTFTATPATGYLFDGWTVNGNTAAEETTRLTLKITEDVEVIANYKLNQVRYNVEFGVVDGNGTLKLNGSTNSPASVNANSDITFTAVPADDYQVEGWYYDAAGTQKIDGTTAEQNTYSINDVVEDKIVYVKFIQIPRYKINIQKFGNGTVTATVNGEAVEIPENGLIEVKNHDNVVLKATPDQYFGRDSWTVNGANKGNAETLTLENVTAHANVTVKFVTVEAIQLTTKVTNNGTIKVESGFGTDLENREAGTGILIPKGHNIVVTATPGSNMMVKGWTINGDPITDPVKGIDHIFKLDNVATDTTIEVEFEDLETFTVPSGTAQYTIENIEETPVDIGGENVVRERGNVTFKIVPVSPNAITELEVSAGEGARIETTKNADGTWTVTIEKVMANIVLNPTVVAGKPLTINCGAGGTVEVTLNSTKVENGYAFKADDVITINARANSGFALESLKLNNADFTSGKTYTVKADDIEIVIDATFKAAPAGGGGGGGFGGGGGGASATYPPVIEESDHGKLIVTPEEPAKGETVVITPVPDAGYMLDEIIVTDNNGNEIELEFKRDGTYTFEQPSGEVTIEGKFKEIVLPFEDVSNKAYYAEAVLWAVENGITTGVTPTLFMPDMTCTRAQAVTFLWRAAGSPAPKSTEMPFIDVPANAYYYDAVIWAVENGITTGTNDGSTFSPDMVCSRSQIVTLIARMEEAEKSEAENPFTDVKESDYYHNSVLWAVENYITKGTTDTTFEPVKDCTRAEIVTFLWRAFR